jgi:hypothetical protein
MPSMITPAIKRKVAIGRRINGSEMLIRNSDLYPASPGEGVG